LACQEPRRIDPATWGEIGEAERSFSVTTEDAA
jgi:hypothetical protein